MTRALTSDVNAAGERDASRAAGAAGAAAPPPVPDHPPALLAIDRRPLVPWGYATLLRLAAFVLLATASCGVLAWILGNAWCLLPAAPFLAVLAAGTWFFRNPGRAIPREPDVLVAPADGAILEIAEVEEREYIHGPALKVAIFLSIFDVHVNRAPEDGVVEHLQYRPGKFLDARDPLSARENECQSIGLRLKHSGQRVLIRQISGAIARRIICPLSKGQAVARGGLIGMIKYGSRTELYIERGESRRWQPAVRKGEKVRGGSAVVCRLGAARKDTP